MSGTYSVALDIPARLLRTACYGYWTLDVETAFEQEVDRHIARYRAAGCKPNSLLVLVDIRESLIQSQQVVARLQGQAFHNDPLVERVAVLVSPSALQRAQVRRIAPSDKKRLFERENEAIAWLDEARASFAQAG